MAVTARNRPRVRRSYIGPACPSCGTAAPRQFQESGAQRCRSCSLRYQATIFTPVADAAPMLITPVGVGGAGTPCAKHSRNVAEASCSRCGTFMCQLCRIDSDGMTLCPGCFDRLAGEGVLASARRTYRDHSRIALAYAVVGLLFMIAGLVLGPLAMWNAVRGLRQRKDGIAISRARCITALIIGAMVSLFGGGTVAVIVLMVCGVIRQ